MQLLKDAAMRGTRALPGAASTTVDGAALDLRVSAKGDFLAQVEFQLSAPAVNTTMVPNGTTMTYSIIHSDNADLSSPVVLMPSVIVQTGAGGAGAAAASYAFKVPTDVKQHLGVRIVSSASTTNAAAVSATLEACF